MDKKSKKAFLTPNNRQGNQQQQEEIDLTKLPAPSKRKEKSKTINLSKKKFVELIGGWKKFRDFL